MRDSAGGPDGRTGSAAAQAGCCDWSGVPGQEWESRQERRDKQHINTQRSEKSGGGGGRRRKRKQNSAAAEDWVQCFKGGPRLLLCLLMYTRGCDQVG